MERPRIACSASRKMIQPIASTTPPPKTITSGLIILTRLAITWPTRRALRRIRSSIARSPARIALAMTPLLICRMSVPVLSARCDAF